MLKKVVGLSALMLAVASSSTFASFVISASKTPNAFPGRDRYDFYGLNVGGGSGTQLKAVFHTQINMLGGAKLFLRVDDLTDSTGEGEPDGIPDTFRPFNEGSSAHPGFSSIRVSNTLSNNVYVPLTTVDPVQPNPYANPVSSFFLELIANTAVTTANTGIGYRFASLYVTAGGDGTISGQLGGETGSNTIYGPILFSTIGITPEPVSLAAVALAASMGTSRRRI